VADGKTGSGGTGIVLMPARTGAQSMDRPLPGNIDHVIALQDATRFATGFPGRSKE